MTRLPRVGPEAWFFLALWLGLMAAGRERFFRDPGTFWHVRTGEIILDTGRFITTDPFTYTPPGRPWTPYEWLAEVGMALVHRVAGIDGLLLVATATLAATFTLPFVRLTRTGLHWSLAACLTALGAAAAASHFHARPHLLTILFLAVTFARLQDYEAGRIRITGLLWLVSLFVVWVNAHGGALGGIGTVGLAVGGWIGAWAIGWPTPVPNRVNALLLVAWAGLIGLTALVTPYGLSLPRTWLEIMRMTELPGFIKEHAPVNPAEASAWPFFAFGMMYLVAIAGLREKPRVTWLLPVVWFALACDRVRHAPLFAVTALLALGDVFPRTVWARWLAIRPDLYRPHAAPSRSRLAGWLVCLAAVCAVLGLQLSGTRVPVVGAGWAEFPEADWPRSLVPDLKRIAAGRENIPAFNEYEFGGFLIYFAPEYRPFVDDRCEVFGGPWLSEFVAAQGDPAPALAKWVAEYGPFEIALTRPGSGFDGYFVARPDEWELVGSAPAGKLYRRRDTHGQ